MIISRGNIACPTKPVSVVVNITVIIITTKIIMTSISLAAVELASVPKPSLFANVIVIVPDE